MITVKTQEKLLRIFFLELIENSEKIFGLFQIGERQLEPHSLQQKKMI